MKTGKEQAATLPQRIPLVVFCIGLEKWLKTQAIHRLKRASLTPGFEEVDLTRFSEAQLSPQAILEAVYTSPFGSPRRLVIIEGLEEVGEGTFPWLAHYVDHPNPRTSIVFCANRLKEGKPLFLRQQRSGLLQVIFCQPLKGRELESWLAARLTEVHKAIEPEAAALLFKRLGNDLGILSLALESLSLLAGSAARIKKSDVEALMTPSVKETAFDILDEAAAGRPEVAVSLLRQALTQGTIAVEQLVGALGWIYRMAWKEKSNPRWGRTAPTWISSQRQAALAALSRWPTPKLEEALQEVLEADVSLKQGHPAPELLADQLLLQLGGS